MIVLSLLCFVYAVFIGSRIVRRVDDRPRPMRRQTDVQVIEKWMSIPYVSKVYGVPLSEFDAVVELNSKNRFESIERIAKQENKDADELLQEIRSIISTFQSSQVTSPHIP